MGRDRQRKSRSRCAIRGSVLKRRCCRACSICSRRWVAGGRIRQLKKGKDLLVIALTGWGQEEDRRKSREAGFDYHLTKPVDIGQLQSLLVPAEVIVERLEASRSPHV